MIINNHNYQPNSRKHIIEIHKNYEKLFKLFRKYEPGKIIKIVFDKNNDSTKRGLNFWRITYFIFAILALWILVFFWDWEFIVLSLCLLVVSVAGAVFTIRQYSQELEKAIKEIIYQEFSLEYSDYEELPEAYKVMRLRLRSIRFYQEVVSGFFNNYLPGISIKPESEEILIGIDKLIEIIKETIYMVDEKISAISNQQIIPTTIDIFAKNIFVPIISGAVAGIIVSEVAQWTSVRKIAIILLCLSTLCLIYLGTEAYSRLIVNLHTKRQELLEFKLFLILLENDLFLLESNLWFYYYQEATD
ncbi:MAG: hypothetical protein KME17_28125 [Cyanosarcina radialis HA8281-LM2]|jgi:hypothetical protein|nr:hypothetical protein [Cyanosarcina radialis HA8281-LM2]